MPQLSMTWVRATRYEALLMMGLPKREAERKKSLLHVVARDVNQITNIEMLK